MNVSKRNRLFADLGKATLRGVRKCNKCGTTNGIRSAVCKNKTCNASLRIDVIAVATKRKLKSGLHCVRLHTGTRNYDVYSVRVRDRGPDYRGFVEVPAINGLDSSSDPSLDTCFIRETAARCLVDCCHRESLPLEAASTRHSVNGNSLHNNIETNITVTIIASCEHAKEAVRCEENATPLNINASLIESFTLEPELKEKILNELNEASFLESPVVQRVSETNFAVKCGASNKHSCGYLHAMFLNSSPNRFSCTCKEFKSNRNQTSRKCSTIPQKIDNLLSAKQLNDRKILTENDAKLSFTDWLSSVTELINQTMHYQLSGKPDPLVFLVSHQHFDCLQNRIATCLRKRSLPNVTTVFRRKESPPLGTFTKFTYILTNVMHVKQIFETPKVCLQLTQRFIQTNDGSYEYLNLPESSFDSHKAINDIYLNQCSNGIFIKPVELRTFLKVGIVSPETKEPIPFIIEWIPDLLPTSKVGEMRIQLQFGHRRNGQIEKRD
ncbi:hypothetical protein B4U80_07077 [Leptotrombidium deliense]|uniref:Putative treble-clef zinc-finger domain-containing protein n=1 Tax=Leptotrombidium deliense TaxID=299467 RepID=A0A443SWP5_9ACAR|nr:hypothetical protein B4U80_07077 [Leptotrombidium deliense]